MKNHSLGRSVRLALASGVAAVVLGIGSAQAQVVVGSDTFQVTANVVGVCSVTANNLNFGAYNQFSGADVDASSTISVLCPNGSSFEVGLDGGLNAGVVATRAMTGGVPAGTQLDYDLFQDAARTTFWGNTFGVDTQAGASVGAVVPFTVFGRIPSGQAPNPGAYTDTVTAVVFF